MMQLEYQEVFVRFWEQVKLSANEGTFAKVTLAKTIGKRELKNIFVRPISELEKEKVAVKLSFRPREMEDEVTVCTLEEAFKRVTPYLKSTFLSVILFSTEKDITFKINKKGVGSITETAPTFTNVTFFEE
ncbi:hypothetical protein [uncultured Polaribacter sp.]|uniref:hypothetical protein n=1 Tax=uncultured Polaribacter sp. TaxID=174711 RepID=UPI00263902A4|nr:hypothetical protein [uncultured Polaribacter sp.]